MADDYRITFRLSLPLKAALAARVRQHGMRVSDIIREALEVYLGLRPTDRPTDQAPASDMSGIMTKLTALVSDVADLRQQLATLEARETQRPRVRQRPTDAADTPQPRTAGGQRKLTPRQVRALRDKHRRGVPVPALMEEYQISRASLFRYLQSEQR